MTKKTSRIQSRGEEIANTITHGLGVVLAPVFFGLLLYASLQDKAQIAWWSVSVYCLGMLMAYLASTLYHWVQDHGIKHHFRVWDHIGIFLLIGGTYTPVVCRYTPESTAIVFLSVMWSLIAAGCLLKLFFTGKYDILSTIIYLFLGWMVVFIIPPLRESMPLDIFLWILAGGLSYSLGVVFYAWGSLRFHHSIWHLFVLAGTIFQFVGVYKSV